MHIPHHDSMTDLLDRALAEDLDSAGDVTSQAIFGPDETAHAIIKSKADGTLSGAWLLKPIFGRLDCRCECTVLLEDGAPLSPGSVICRLTGPIRAILAGERLALNLLQRLSGIATRTAQLVALCRGTRALVLDTRKTTPTLRFLEKQAVVHGGGANHRFGLFDMILIKDTHVQAAGGVAPAIARARSYAAGRNLKIEVEVQTEEEFAQALTCRPDRIMLDNMSCEVMHRCVVRAHEERSGVELEASGNVSPATITAIARTGVDYISVGSITHSVSAVDIHLIIEPPGHAD